MMRMAYLRRRARPVRRVLEIAAALVFRVLRIRAQRTGEARRPVGGWNRRRRYVLLAPLLERPDRVERVGTVAAAAVPHAWHHEQPREVGDVPAAHFLHDAVVVLDGVDRRD